MFPTGPTLSGFLVPEPNLLLSSSPPHSSSSPPSSSSSMTIDIHFFSDLLCAGGKTVAL